MASSGQIRAGRAFVELFADTSKLDKALKDLGAKFKALGTMLASTGKHLMAAGAAIVMPLIGLAKLTGTMGDQLAKMSTRTGVSVEALSELGFAAGQASISLEDVETGIKKMQKSMEEAAGGSAEAVKAFDALGLTIEDLRGLTPDQQFARIGDAISKLADPSLKAATAMAIFGKSGTGLLPLFSDGAAGMEAMRKKAQELGLTISTYDAKAAEAFASKLDEVWAVIKRAGFAVGSVLLPPLTTVADTVERLVGVVRGWITQNREVIVLALAAGAAIVGIGAALYVAGTAIVWAVGVFKAIGTALSAAWSVLSTIGALLPLLASPVGILAAVVAGAAAAWLYFSGAGGKALAWLSDRLGEFLAWGKEVFQGIADALIAGDLKLAAEVAWKAMKAAWAFGVMELRTIWAGFRAWFTNSMIDMWSGISQAWELGTTTVASLLLTLTNNVTKWTNKIGSAVSDAFGDLPLEMSKEWTQLQKDMGVISPEEADKKLAAIDKALRGSWNRGLKKQDEIDAEAALKQTDEQKKLEDDATAKLNAIKAAAEKAKTDNATPDDAVAAATEEYKKAQADLQESLKKAKGARTDHDAKALEAGTPPGPADFVPGMQAAQSAHFGTFSAAVATAAGGMGGGGIISELKTANQEAKKQTDLLEKLNEGSYERGVEAAAYA